MRKFPLAICSCVLLCIPFASAAGQQDSGQSLPLIVLSGLSAYRVSGPDAAVKAWIAGSLIEGSKAALSQADNLRQVQDFYGGYRGFEVIDSRDITPKTRIIYLVLDYEKGPLFGEFLVYRTDQDWILTSFNFNTDQAKILPETLYSPIR